MFPLSVVHAGRLRGPDEPLVDAYDMRGWLIEQDGEISGFLGLNGGGFLLPMWPEADWPALRPHLAGQAIAAIVGPDGQAPAVLAGLGLDRAPMRHRDEEPGFILNLDAMVMPDVDGFRLAPLTDAMRDLVTIWRMDYLTAIFSVHGDQAQARAAGDVARWMAADSHRLLLRGDRPVALTGFNARLPQVVQVGGVYTPLESRGQGLARRAVALHLDQARGQGVARAVLFAANESAAAAYRAIGFMRDGSMGVIEFETRCVVQP